MVEERKRTRKGGEKEEKMKVLLSEARDVR